MKTLWDKRYSQETLEKWFYGEASLGGSTRKWFLDEAITWEKGTTLLDAGCGGGVTAYQLNQIGLLDKIKYVGIDFSRCMLDFAKQKVQHPNITWRISSLEHLCINEKFDRILLRAVLAHVYDPTPILRSVITALKTGGYLYIIFWNNPTIDNEPKIKIIQGGFYDNAHAKVQLLKILHTLNTKIVKEYKIKEDVYTSRSTNYRIIWKCQKQC